MDNIKKQVKNYLGKKILCPVTPYCAGGRVLYVICSFMVINTFNSPRREKIVVYEKDSLINFFLSDQSQLIAEFRHRLLKLEKVSP